MHTLKILLYLIITWSVHGCSPTFYSVMPNDLVMLEKKGDHLAGVGVGVAPLLFNYIGFSGYYPYALPTGFRLRADLQLLRGDVGDLSQDVVRSQIYTAGVGLAYYRRFDEKVQWETNIMVRTANGRVRSEDLQVGTVDLLGRYSLLSTNLYSGVRYLLFDKFFVGGTVGYQFNSYEMFDPAAGPNRIRRVLTDYNNLDRNGHFVFGTNYTVQVDNFKLLLFANFSLGADASFWGDNYNATLLGTRVTIGF